MMQLLGIDIGGTNIKIATVAPDGTVIQRGLIETAPSEGAARAFKRIHAAARALGPVGIEAVGIGCAGLVDERRGVLTASPNLKEWEHAPLARIASKNFSVPILIQNDANCAAYGESVVRGARGRDLILITLGTGVGGGIVMDGRLVRGATGFGGEIGHSCVDVDGPPCHCGKRGCLETMIGDEALLRLAARGDLEPTEENVAALLDDARAGDETVLAAVRTIAGWLGQALGNLVNTLNPQRVILGGSLSGVLELARVDVEKALEHYAFDPGHPVELVLPQLGADSALLGAAELAFADLLDDPFVGQPASA